MIKTSVHVSDEAYARLIEMAFEQGYVRGKRSFERPHGLSAFVSTLGTLEWLDARPTAYADTGLWHTGMSTRRERCLHLSQHAIADIGHLALQFGIFPFKTQAPVANGFRKNATIPILYQIGSTPLGHTSIKALVGPVLEAIGLGWLIPLGALPHAPLDLYKQPSRADERRSRIRALARSDAY